LENVKHQSRADIKRVTREFQTQLQHVKESNTLAISQKDAALRDEQKLRKAERAECTSYAELSTRLKERNAALEKDLNESRKAQLRLQDQMAALQNSFNEGLYNEEQQGRLAIEKLKEEHERELRNQLLAPNAKIAQLEKLLEDARKASAVAEASEKTGLQKAVSRLNLEVARLSSRNFDLEQEAMDRLTMTESQEQAAADLRKELEASQTEARMLREELSEIQNASVLEENKLRDEQRRLETERVHTVNRTEELEQLLEEAKEAHSAEIERMKNGHALHVDNVRRNAEAAVIKAGEVVEKQRKEKERLATELEAVKAKLNGGETEVLDLRNEILVANDHAEDVERHRDELREELAAARAALGRGEAAAEQARRDLAALRADYEEISEATAKRVAEVMRGKEKEWQRKMAELNTELDLRSKLLMIEWGRKEMGAADPQAYRYLD
jgi:chromosome segregation ATPase